ncbi:hypothetical protein BVX99_00520, partial [bacterium F16]
RVSMRPRRSASSYLRALHYRTALCQYRPSSDGWERFALAKQMLDTSPLFASGDLLTVDACTSLVDALNLDGITPARGLLNNPWLLRDIEAEICGRKRVDGNVIPFLIRLVECGHDKPNWRPGKILDIAKIAWGDESAMFQELAHAHRPDRILEVLRANDEG